LNSACQCAAIQMAVMSICLLASVVLGTVPATLATSTGAQGLRGTQGRRTDTVYGRGQNVTSLERRVRIELDRPYVLHKDFDLRREATQDFDVVVIPDANMTHSCANYVDDGSTVFTRDGNLVLKVSSACPGGRCLNSGRVMSKQGFRYGVFVFKAKVPKCHYVWPALWLLPSSSKGDGAYGTWPCSGEIDVLETVHKDSWGAFNLVAGFGANKHPDGFCAAPKAPACNRCAEPAYCTSTTLEHMTESFYYVEDTDCSAKHPSWSEHTFVLFWQPDKIATWVDPELTFDGTERLVNIKPSGRKKTMKVWGKEMEVPSWKAYERQTTPTWDRVGDFMEKCYPETAAPDAPFDKDFKIVLNIAIGGYGGSPCTWDTDSCTNVCGGAIGSELVISELKVYERS
jgi:hypothetical protein